MRIIICMEVDSKVELSVNEIVEMLKGPGHLGGESEMLDISEVDVYTGDEMKLVPIYSMELTEETESQRQHVEGIEQQERESAYEAQKYEALSELEAQKMNEGDNAFVPEPTLVPKRSRARQPHSKENS